MICCDHAVSKTANSKFCSECGRDLSIAQSDVDRQILRLLGIDDDENAKSLCPTQVISDAITVVSYVPKGLAYSLAFSETIGIGLRSNGEWEIIMKGSSFRSKELWRALASGFIDSLTDLDPREIRKLFNS